jgi:hypothetical protein
MMAELSMNIFLASELVILCEALKLVPETDQDSRNEVNAARGRFEDVIEMSDWHAANVKAKNIYGRLTEIARLIDMSSNPVHKVFKRKTNITSAIADLAGPVGVQLMMTINHNTMNPVLDHQKGEEVHIPVITYSFVVGHILAKPLGATGGDSAAERLLDIMCGMGLARVVVGFDEYIAQYREEARKLNPVGLMVDAFTDEALKDHGLKTVGDPQEGKKRAYGKNEKFVVFTSEYFQVVTRILDVASKWNEGHAEALVKTSRSFHQALETHRPIWKRGLAGAVAALAVLAGTSGQADDIGNVGSDMTPVAYVAQNQSKGALSYFFANRSGLSGIEYATISSEVGLMASADIGAFGSELGNSYVQVAKAAYDSKDIMGDMMADIEIANAGGTVTGKGKLITEALAFQATQPVGGFWSEHAMLQTAGYKF